VPLSELLPRPFIPPHGPTNETRGLMWV
jgi:hypothetical protein